MSTANSNLNLSTFLSYFLTALAVHVKLLLMSFASPLVIHVSLLFGSSQKTSLHPLLLIAKWYHGMTE